MLELPCNTSEDACVKCTTIQDKLQDLFEHDTVQQVLGMKTIRAMVYL